MSTKCLSCGILIKKYVCCLHCVCSSPDCENIALFHGFCYYHSNRRCRNHCDTNCWQCKQQSKIVLQRNIGEYDYIIESLNQDKVLKRKLVSSIALNMFVKDQKFDFEQLIEVTKLVTRNLNRLIGHHRPIGIGVQGLGDAFILMRFPFDSKEATQLNLDIFKTIYSAACTESADLAEIYGAYNNFHITK